jgi:hypothetical protein
MPTKRSRKLTLKEMNKAGLRLEDETNHEFFERLKMLAFLKWMTKHKLRLPTGIEEAHRLVTEYLKDERARMRKEFMKIMKDHERKKGSN